MMEMYGMTGERLGSIGLGSPEEPMPNWKEALLSKPSISIRQGIARGYHPPYEDTDTLVLTASSGTFIDIRFPLSATSRRDESAFWAFAGMSTVTFPEDSVMMPYMAHCVWEHEIDSKEPTTDEGDLYLLGNGDVAEVGVGDVNGQLQMYKEYWTSPKSASKAMDCVVARTAETKTSSRGIIIRVGNSCQAILRETDREHVWVERWTRTSVDAENEATWVCDERNDAELGEGELSTEHGSVRVPCSWACAMGRKEGDEILAMGRKWIVTEATGC